MRPENRTWGPSIDIPDAELVADIFRGISDIANDLYVSFENIGTESELDSITLSIFGWRELCVINDFTPDKPGSQYRLNASRKSVLKIPTFLVMMIIVVGFEICGGRDNMTRNVFVLVLSLCGAVLTLQACGGDTDPPLEDDAGISAESIGTEGGTVQHEALELIIPAGALDEVVLIQIDVVATPLDIPDGAWASEMFRLRPEGLEFALPVEVVYTEEGLPEDAIIVSTIAGSNTEFERLESVVSGGRVTATIEHFSLLGMLLRSSVCGLIPPYMGALAEPCCHGMCFGRTLVNVDLFCQELVGTGLSELYQTAGICNYQICGKEGQPCCWEEGVLAPPGFTGCNTSLGLVCEEDGGFAGGFGGWDTGTCEKGPCSDYECPTLCCFEKEPCVWELRTCAKREDGNGGCECVPSPPPPPALICGADIDNPGCSRPCVDGSCSG